MTATLAPARNEAKGSVRGAPLGSHKRGTRKERRPVTATPYIWTPPETIPTRDFIYGRHLIRKFVSGSVGPGGFGKTSKIIGDALAMVSARDLLGYTLPSVGKMRVWYLNLEDPRDETTRQIQAAALYHGLTPDDIGNRLFVDSGREQEFVIAEMEKDGAVICRPVADSIRSELIDRRIDVLIVDPFVSSHKVSENDNSAMDLVVKEWGRIADDADCAVHLIHHTRKGAGEITTESSRGGKALTDGFRSVQTLNQMTKEEAQSAGVENHRRYFRVYADKANLAPPSEKSDWFFLENVCLQNGGAGPSDQVGVVTRWKWPDPFKDVTLSDLRRVQDRIARGEWKKSSQAKAWAGNAVAEILDLDLADDGARKKVRDLLKTWLKTGALKEVEGVGKDRHKTTFIQVGEWANDP